jgi:hypothetical protein
MSDKSSNNTGASRSKNTGTSSCCLSLFLSHGACTYNHMCGKTRTQPDVKRDARDSTLRSLPANLSQALTYRTPSRKSAVSRQRSVCTGLCYFYQQLSIHQIKTIQVYAIFINNFQYIKSKLFSRLYCIPLSHQSAESRRRRAQVYAVFFFF